MALQRALLLGGSHGSLALARSLRKAGVEVWFVTDAIAVPCYSRSIARVIRWPGPDDPAALDALEAIAEANSLAGSVVIPAGDAEVRLVAQARERLASRFTVLLQDWERLRWACEKALAYRHAARLGLATPRVHERDTLGPSSPLQFPLVLKPSMRVQRNRFTDAKAWRVDHRAEFDERYPAACELVGAENVVVQELVPGGGENQLSYAGFWNTGKPVISFTARRLRQYPLDFGYTSTYVETADLHDAREAAESFLRSIDFHGLVEVEFKRDPRDGAPKLLDVNPRPWTWLSLAEAAGIDLGAAIVCTAAGGPMPPMRARSGVAWMFASRDLVALARTRPGLGSFLHYPASCSRTRAFAAFSWDDPLPGLMELPVTLMRVAQRRWHAGKR